MQSPHMHHPSDDDADRTNRFLTTGGADSPNTLSLRERAASQPPRSSSNQAFLASPSLHSVRPNPAAASAWPRFSSGLNSNSTLGALPQSVPTRSSSFSSSATPQSLFPSAMREARFGGFASTFEDDESALSDHADPIFDDRLTGGLHQSAIGTGMRGRTYAPDMTRSRSQSVATTTARSGTIGSPFSNNVWNDSSPLSIPSSRYGELRPPTSQYGSLGAMGRSPSTGYSHGVGSFTDHSNMSPFVRDVGQILLDDRSAFKDLLVNPPIREENGGGSGTTSRRHSVSIVQTRRPTIVGFNAPSADVEEPSYSRPGVFTSALGNSGRSALMLGDDELADDLGMLNLGREDEIRRSASYGTDSTPSSLPIYAPTSRSPPAPERLSPYQPLQLNIPGSSYAARQGLGSPHESAFSGGSPSRLHDLEAAGAQMRQGLTARYVPGQGIQHIPETSIFAGHPGAGAMRSPTHLPRRPSDATKPLTELGKGVPLHAVPTSWPLFIVEFKAKRTDLFYCTDLSLDIRVGDLVIVEADRGKDLGRVVNDTITLAEVEAFQKQQKMLNGYAEAAGQSVPMSPTGGSKEINPKMIYSKASHQDTQSLATKIQDEAKALELCRSKVKQRKLPMEVIDAEYQWDRRKLTFYFTAEKRIDFRELVRELFRLYKTRIWMASLGGPGGYDQ
ncbi:hypothetical protein EIP86_005817 [Pleurotus ostreatoroseus]|nr:hypothetical protein EIP86_005817 [Pleurotus ostreatoroseus]